MKITKTQLINIIAKYINNYITENIDVNSNKCDAQSIQ